MSHTSSDRPNGKTALMKALLNLKNGDNKTVEHLLGIAERMGYLDKLVNAAYTDGYYEGTIVQIVFLITVTYIFQPFYGHLRPIDTGRNQRSSHLPQSHRQANIAQTTQKKVSE